MSASKKEKIKIEVNMIQDLIDAMKANAEKNSWWIYTADEIISWLERNQRIVRASQE